MTDQDLAPAQNGNRAARPSERPPNLLNYLLKKGRGHGPRPLEQIALDRNRLRFQQRVNLLAKQGCGAVCA